MIYKAMVCCLSGLLFGTAAAKAASTDLTADQKFLAEHPHFLEDIRALIDARGYECPRLGKLWLTGYGPLGAKLEALCGPRGTTDLNRKLHYTIYPKRLQVDLCKPFDSFGGGCD